MIYVELEILYSVKFKNGKIEKFDFYAFLPQTLACELIKGVVCKQMEFFINNLALLQGAEEGMFVSAVPRRVKNEINQCICEYKNRMCSDCNLNSAYEN